MNKQSVLIVDDDKNILKLLRSVLEKNNYLVIESQTGKEALDCFKSNAIDVVLLDLMLPDIDGIEILKQMRLRTGQKYIPVIVLTSKDSEFDTVLCLEIGADDYIVKPVRYRELLARLKVVLRRNTINNQTNFQKIVLDKIEIIPDTRTVSKNGQPLKLTYIEFELLFLFAKNPKKVFSRSDLLEKIWAQQPYIETRTVDVHVQRLRKKVFNDMPSLYIETIRNVGYCLQLKM